MHFHNKVFPRINSSNSYDIIRCQRTQYCHLTNLCISQKTAVWIHFIITITSKPFLSYKFLSGLYSWEPISPIESFPRYTVGINLSNKALSRVCTSVTPAYFILLTHFILDHNVLCTKPLCCTYIYYSSQSPGEGMHTTEYSWNQTREVFWWWSDHLQQSPQKSTHNILGSWNTHMEVKM